MLPDRKFSHLTAYFSSFSKHERQKVKFFVSDMWKPYMEIAKAYFPNATIIVDKYHFFRKR
ncbi:transposase [Aequitasia blattaphilus]|uniref:Transposase n=1 Tax=Aequitasia blattaphilus TaxID=2949332 RepID=A0ABT1EC07_9FIRM|nr:transposase [Aequitasia blattaphilus]MCP1103360.1 transposase [Aequitasia blattaphilus]MCR8616000.1 transposase [Aequitasia blattaphilus]